MTQSHRRLATLALALMSFALVSAHADSAVNIDVRSNLPVSCEASIVTSQLVTTTPLLINATIRRICNTKHDLSVTYNPQSVTQPNRLFITFDSAAPNVKLSGAQVFTNLPHTNSIKPLTIRYSGGTLLQRRELARTWGITVTPH
ncbi:MAG: hypothetical protein ABL996_07685 [Micropepsaceae bacterium]